ncbi:hypothetical protein ACP275_12G046400 [Erythranthe tilingii]
MSESTLAVIYRLNFRFSTVDNLYESTVFDGILMDCWFDMRRIYRLNFTFSHVKCRVEELRTRFYVFNEYIRRPGVTFISTSLCVECSETYFTSRVIGRKIL